jgi:hypothetical protein
MPSRNDPSILQRIREMSGDPLNRVLDEVVSSPRFAEFLGTAVQQAMATKGQVDRKMQTILSLLSLPSKADYKKLSSKVEALQGSLVNLNIKLDRVLAQQQKAAAAPKAAAPKKAKPKAPAPASDTTGPF